MSTMSERIKIKTRARRIRRIKRLFILFLLLSLPMGLWHLIHQPDFAWGEIQIRGTSLLTVEDVVSLGEGHLPVNILLVDRSRLEEALAHDVRFLEAETSYGLPNILQVQVVERKPALYLQNAHKNYVMLDDQGLVMNVTSGIPSDDAPMLLGWYCGDVYIGDRVQEQELLGLLSFLRQVGPETVDQFAEIEVNANQEVIIQLCSGPDILLGKMDQVEEKAKIFTTVYKEIKDRQLGAVYIDFTYKKPYVKVDEHLAPKLLQGVDQ